MGKAGQNIGIGIYLFGPFRMKAGAGYVSLGISGVTEQILTYLMLHPGKVFRRDVIASLFWKNSPTAQARAALSTALWRLHKCCDPLEGVTIESSDKLIWLELEDMLAIDFHRLQYWHKEARQHRRTDLRLTPMIRKNLTQCLEDCQGDYLDGCETQWAHTARESAITLRLNTISQLIDDAQERGRITCAIQWAQLGLQDDPLHEWFHHRLIELYALSSQRSKAILQYDTLKTILAKELGIAPLPETLELRNSIISVSSLPAASPILNTVSKDSGELKTAAPRG